MFISHGSIVVIDFGAHGYRGDRSSRSQVNSILQAGICLNDFLTVLLVFPLIYYMYRRSRLLLL